MGVGYQMNRVNSLEKLLHGIHGYLRRKSAGLHGDVCLVCSDSGEAVTLNFRNGSVTISPGELPDKLVFTRRQLAQLIFGSHHSVAPVEPSGLAAEILGTVFPYYFPIWELDHC